ncbi:helix-turn-helix transcriptional regulator [Acetobacter okinawensis]|uniref:helix-turn-helix transcriptional regulator n=1 Tax=Acetobacter okinawensis TaxID=1076594 RepID=UPI0039E8BF8E
MRPTNRLFQIIQILRRSTRPVTAASLAEELEVSPRTIYRDMAHLVGQGIPIDGEAGFGYLLTDKYDFPPLMFTQDELEAMSLGAQWVANGADKILANAARDVISKIAAVIPDRLCQDILEPSVGVKPKRSEAIGSIDTTLFRTASRSGNKIRLAYRAAGDERSARTVWPVIVGYTETCCILIAWCELRQDFRHFRLDQIIEAEVLPETNGLRKGELRRRYLRWHESKVGEYIREG